MDNTNMGFNEIQSYSIPLPLWVYAVEGGSDDVRFDLRKTLDDRNNSFFMPSHCTADGVTDNYSAIIEKLTESENKTLIFGPGTYAVTMGSIGFGSINSGTSVIGAGKEKTIIRIDKTESTYLNIISLNNVSNVLFKDLTIDLNIANGVSSALFRFLTATNVRFENCKFIGNGASNATDNQSFFLSLNTGSTYTRTNIQFFNCDFTGWAGVLLKTNTADSNDYQYMFNGCRFFDNVSEHLEFNSPIAVFDEIYVLNCKFEYQGIQTVGTGFHISIAGCSNVVVSNNVFDGNTDFSAIHIENYNDKIIISNNIIDIVNSHASGGEDTYGSGISFLQNTIGGDGSERQAAKVIVANNIINGDSSLGTRAGYGITFYSGDGTSPISDTVITGNVIKDFKHAFALYPTTGESLWVADNVISDCDNGHANSTISRTYWGQNKYVNVDANRFGHFEYASNAPSSGSYLVGDVRYHNVPTAGGNIGWVCTTAGSPGTWKTFGTIQA